MFRQIKDYVIDQQFRFSYQGHKLNVVNYMEIITLEENRISLKYQEGVLTVKGEDLKVHRLLDEEVLISGQIKSIELG